MKRAPCGSRSEESESGWEKKEREEERRGEAKGEKEAKIDVVGRVEIKDGWMRWDRGSRPLG